MTSWKGIRTIGIAIKRILLLTITDEESVQLMALAQARMQDKRYYLEDSTDGSDSTEDAIDVGPPQNLAPLVPVPVEADHDPTVDVGRASNNPRLPSPARKSPPLLLLQR